MDETVLQDVFQVVAIAHKAVGIIAQTRVVRLEDILESIGVAVLYSLKEFALFGSPEKTCV